MPSKIIISIETDDGPRRDLHTVLVPDLPADVGEGSQLLAERFASRAALALSEDIAAEMPGA